MTVRVVRTDVYYDSLSVGDPAILSMSTHSSTTPWHAAFPQPASMEGLEKITPSALKDIMSDSSKISGKDYLVVDARRTDFEVWRIDTV